MLGGEDAEELIHGVLAVALEHHAHALLGRRKALIDVGGRTLQADGIDLDQGIVLQGVVVQNLDRLLVAVQNAADGHIAGLVELLMHVSRQGVCTATVI